MKRKNSQKDFSIFKFWLVLIIFIFGAVIIATNLHKIDKFKNRQGNPLQITKPSGFYKALAEAKKKEEVKKTTDQQHVQSYGPCRFVPILMYHHIGPPKNWLYVDPQTFISQMDYLVSHGYTSMSLPEIVTGLQNNSFPPKPVAITFDDGYSDVFNNAYHVLADRNLKATFFIITQLRDGDYMSWEQVKEISGNPLMAIGDHTLSHRTLVGLSDDQVKDEILSSKRILEEQTGKTINTFSYPYGSETPRDTKYLVEGNFVAAVNTLYGSSCAKQPYDLRRIRIGRLPLSSYGL